MKFDCKEISISDEEFGCSISFSDREDKGYSESDTERTIDEIINSLGTYVSIHRTYPEDDFDQDYYYLETSDFEKNSGELNNFNIHLFRTQFIMTHESETFEISFHVSDKIFENIKRILGQITTGTGQLNFHD